MNNQSALLTPRPAPPRRAAPHLKVDSYLFISSSFRALATRAPSLPPLLAPRSLAIQAHDSTAARGASRLHERQQRHRIYYVLREVEHQQQQKREEHHHHQQHCRGITARRRGESLAAAPSSIVASLQKMDLAPRQHQLEYFIKKQHTRHHLLSTLCSLVSIGGERRGGALEWEEQHVPCNWWCGGAGRAGRRWEGEGEAVEVSQGT
ncbi:hypothetical protein E2C01_078411 [Portunus trituberculatus]|uniref:Uncharacterized protein n=1 Tax=Portunus trituberculatus TaxID=210409 RepID=A0A5B7IQ29_PORTR|nr:hypothetical protein [Portunus trituberculatus]